MISPELLRRFPFFGVMKDEYLKMIAMHTEEVAFESGATLLSEGERAEGLYFLLDGNIDLYHTVETAYRPELSRDFRVGEINPGEAFGLSACIEPRIYTATARAAKDSRVLKIEAAALQNICQQDKEFAYGLMNQVANIAMQRLNSTRVQLAAAWA